MAKKVLLAAIALLFLVSCSKTITVEQYTSVMTAIGCRGVFETDPGAALILKDQGVTQEQINEFRRKMDPKKTAEIAMDISRRVMACHGVGQ